MFAKFEFEALFAQLLMNFMVGQGQPINTSRKNKTTYMVCLQPLNVFQSATNNMFNGLTIKIMLNYVLNKHEKEKIFSTPF